MAPLSSDEQPQYNPVNAGEITDSPTSEASRLPSEALYRTLFESIDDAFCIIHVLFDESGTPYDYRFLASNPAFDRHTGLVEPVGKTIRELVPNIDESWFPIYGNVVVTGEPVRFENHDPALSRWFDAYALRLGPAENCRVGILFTDITARKMLEEEREQLLKEQERLSGEQRVLLFEQMRLLDEQRTRAEHERLLNQISAAARSTLEPDAILQATVSALGQGLGVDRCYFVRIDLARDLARVTTEWSRDPQRIPALLGRAFKISTYAVDRSSAYYAGRTHVMDDVTIDEPDGAAILLSLNVRSIIRVPIEVGNYTTGLSIAMADKPRHWTADEVRLVENVAALVRSALESAQLQQRERNIAVQLQEALQPSPPGDLPGLALASHYRPALAEASVGGDFFDVFPVEDGCTALVVADLSGKGLAAASQVAMVRNMLRYALYSAATLAEAVTGLHRALVKHELLTGFATLFIGVYDEFQRSIAYVNCGQEPGLIWRAATGAVERMSATGPVLGGFGAGDFDENVVSLSTGDVLALFTDGLTEVGPSRKMQLEIDGVSEVLRNCCGRTSVGRKKPQSVVDCLISGVDDFARGGARDDIALLVGVVGI